MKEPKVELKNVKTFRGMEGYGLNADIWINGVKCMFVMDEANGGEFDYEELVHGVKNAGEVKALIQELRDYIDNLPKEPMIIGGKPYTNEKGEVMLYKQDMDSYINNILLKQDKEKAQKKMRKQFNTAIVFGVPDAASYQYLNFKRPLSEVNSLILQGKYNEIKSKYCKNGVVVFNDNLTALGVKL